MVSEWSQIDIDADGRSIPNSASGLEEFRSGRERSGNEPWRQEGILVEPDTAQVHHGLDERARAAGFFANDDAIYVPGADVEVDAPEGTFSDDDLQLWIERITKATEIRRDNTDGELLRTQPLTPDQIYRDPVFLETLRHECNLSHEAGHRVHGFVFECVCAMALRRAGFDAVLTRGGGRADIAIDFLGPPPETLGLQLKSFNADAPSNKRSKRVDLNERSTEPFTIGHYASMREAMTVFEEDFNTGHPEDEHWTWAEFFDNPHPDNYPFIAAAVAAVTRDHLSGYADILHCETFTIDGDTHVGLTAISADLMHAEIDRREAFEDRHEGESGHQFGGRKRSADAHRDDRIKVFPNQDHSRWIVQYWDDGPPEEMLFQARMAKNCKLELEKIIRRPEMVVTYDPIAVSPIFDFGIRSRDAGDDPDIATRSKLGASARAARRGSLPPRHAATSCRGLALGE